MQVIGRSARMARYHKRHEAAEANPVTFSYTKPEGVGAGKGFITLGRKDIVRGVVQVVKKHGGENNLHYHTSSASFWMVLKGRVRFYGPGDVVLGEFGPNEGMITPRYSRYWFAETAKSGIMANHLLSTSVSDLPETYADAADDLRGVDRQIEVEIILARLDRHYDFFKRGIAGTLAQAIDGAFNLPRAADRAHRKAGEERDEQEGGDHQSALPPHVAPPRSADARQPAADAQRRHCSGRDCVGVRGLAVSVAEG